MIKPPVGLLLDLIIFAVLACGIGAGAARASNAENQVDQAQALSRVWLAQIDGGKYDESYDFTCDAVRDKFPEDHWVAVLDTIRGKLYGAVVSRTQTSHVYKPNGVPGLSGECVVMTYDTSFRNYNTTEIVVLTWQDGKWRGASYSVAPKADADSVAPSAPQTEVHTQSHVAPNQAPAGQ